MTATVQLRIETADLAGLLRFYLALGSVQQARDEHTVTLQLANLSIKLVQTEAKAGAHSAVDGERLQLQVRVPDVAATLAALVDAGGHADDDAAADGARLVRAPDGHLVRLISAAAAPADIAATVPQSTATSDQTSADTSPPTAPPVAAPAASVQSSSSGPVAPSDSALLPDPGLPQSSLPASYYTEGGVPTFDAVADRIAQRTATADGNAVLDGESARGTAEADGMEKLKKAGKDRLDQLRKSMGL